MRKGVRCYPLLRYLLEDLDSDSDPGPEKLRSESDKNIQEPILFYSGPSTWLFVWKIVPQTLSHVFKSWLFRFYEVLSAGWAVSYDLWPERRAGDLYDSSPLPGEQIWSLCSSPAGWAVSQDPHVFGPPGSGSISQRYGSGSGYFLFLI